MTLRLNKAGSTEFRRFVAYDHIGSVLHCWPVWRSLSIRAHTSLLVTYLINQSISQGIFPEELKLAKVLPIFKCEDEQLVQNYRPISILPFFSRVFEQIVSKYIIEFMDENELFYKNQFGFRKQHSTSHAIITLIEKVSKALDTGKIVVGVFLDLKRLLTQLITHYY